MQGVYLMVSVGRGKEHSFSWLWYFRIMDIWSLLHITQLFLGEKHWAPVVRRHRPEDRLTHKEVRGTRLFIFVI